MAIDKLQSGVAADARARDADLAHMRDSVRVGNQIARDNLALARELGFNVPPGGQLTPELEQQLLEALSYRAPGKTEPLFADRYGGTGLGVIHGRAEFLPVSAGTIKGVGLTDPSKIVEANRAYHTPADVVHPAPPTGGRPPLDLSATQVGHSRLGGGAVFSNITHPSGTVEAAKASECRKLIGMGNYASALNLANQALSPDQHPKDFVFGTIRAVVLHRMGLDAEASAAQLESRGWFARTNNVLEQNLDRAYPEASYNLATFQLTLLATRFSGAELDQKANEPGISGKSIYELASIALAAKPEKFGPMIREGDRDFAPLRGQPGFEQLLRDAS